MLVIVPGGRSLPRRGPGIGVPQNCCPGGGRAGGAAGSKLPINGIPADGGCTSTWDKGAAALAGGR